MTDIFTILKDKGHNTVPKEYYQTIDLWESWYKGKVAKFHTFKVFNGQKHVNCQRYSMGMAKKVSEDWANLLMNEKVQITPKGEKEQKFINDVLSSTGFSAKINEMQEFKAALGTVAYIPRASGVMINPETGEIVAGAGEIKIDYATADSIFPLSWENGTITECAFAAEKIAGDKKYLYLQRHVIGKDGNYEIHNHVFKKGKNGFEEVEPSSVTEFKSLPAVVHTGSPLRQFVIDRLNIANNVNKTCPLGLSVYANAIDQLKGVDVAYDSYVNEFVLGKKRIMVKPEAVKNFENGEPLFDVNELTFYILPEGAGNDSSIKEIDMKLRTAEHNAGMQDMLNTLSAKCGFGENHYKYDRGSVSTATQIISENGSLFRTLKKHELILDGALKELCRILLRLGNAYLGASLDADIEISIAFDDSIIINTEDEREQDRRDVSMGAMSLVEYRAKWYGEDEKTAREKLPGMESLVKDE